MSERSLFKWTSFDVSTVLPHGWQGELLSFAKSNARKKNIVPTSVTSRESRTVAELPVLTVGGSMIKSHLGWLDDLYRGLFRELASTTVTELVSPAQDDRYGVNLNVQLGNTMRYEAHVDSNPIEGLLYVTSHPSGSGGELVVGNQHNATGIEEIDADATTIYPHAGQLVFFDARKHSHYVRPLKAPDGTRVVVAMNYYTPSCSEADRPADLNSHLGIE